MNSDLKYTPKSRFTLIQAIDEHRTTICTNFIMISSFIIDMNCNITNHRQRYYIEDYDDSKCTGLIDFNLNIFYKHFITGAIAPLLPLLIIMSHFTVMVIWNNSDEQLKKYDANIEYDPYVARVVPIQEKYRILQYYNKKYETNYSINDFDKVYEEHWESWNWWTYKKNKDWVREERATYNPFSKRDWYLLWWRRSWKIKLKEWREWVVGKLSMMSKMWWDKPWIDQAKKWDIANLEEITTFAYVKDWVWYQQWEMLWRWIHTQKIDKDDWEKQVTKVVKELPDDTLISIYDCHI